MFTKAFGHLRGKGIIQLSFANMAQCQESFRGQTDRYNGIIVDSALEPCEMTIFPNRLEASLEKWIKDERKAVWFKVDLSQSYWIPELTKRGFKFHHAKEEQAMLYRWLPKVEIKNIPPYAHTSLGVGAVVLNEKTNEILVIKEKFGVSSQWKLPGGYVEPNEDITTAIEREVLEETGIIAKFKCVLAFRHMHQMIFGCSDIYTISFLTPETLQIAQCPREISECRWMKLDEYATHPSVNEHNRSIARKLMEYLEHRMGLAADYATHPINKKPLCIFTLSNTSKP